MGNERAIFHVGVALIVTAGPLACRQLVGIGDQPPGATSEVCGLADAGGACGECISASCCPESTACAGSPVCAQREACFARCHGEPACRAQCILDSRVGVSREAAQLDACLASNCESACSLPACGDFGSSFSPPEAAAACGACIAASSCAAGKSCASSASLAGSAP